MITLLLMETSKCSAMFSLLSWTLSGHTLAIILLLNKAECCQAKVDNTIQDLHNSSDHTIAKSNSVFYYSFTTIIRTLKTCLLTLINIPQQIQDSLALILSILLYFLFGKRLNFSCHFLQLYQNSWANTTSFFVRLPCLFLRDSAVLSSFCSMSPMCSKLGYCQLVRKN